VPVARAIGSLVAFGIAVALLGCGSSASRGDRVRTLIVLDRSIGGIALRERRSEAERILGRGAVIQTSDQKPPEPPAHTEAMLYPSGLKVYYVSRDAASRMRGRVVLLVTSSPTFRTRHGVHVGSSAAELHSIKGVTCYNLLKLDCRHGGSRHNQPGTFFRLTGTQGKVSRIAIGYAD
jgi:hypothetical protein